MAVNRHAIGAGWGLGLEDLTLVTSITDSVGNRLSPPRALGTYNPGILEPRMDRLLTVAGIETVAWVWDQEERSFRTVLRNTYCGTNRKAHSGRVTIYTPFEEPDDSEYYLCNATLYLDPISALNYQGDVDWYNNFAVHFAIDLILDAP